MRRRSLFLRMLMLIFLFSLAVSQVKAQNAADNPDASTELNAALIVAIDTDAANLSIRDCPNPSEICSGARLMNVRVDSPALRTSLKQFQVGDRVHLKISFIKAQASSGTAAKPDAAASGKNTSQSGPTGGAAPVTNPSHQPEDKPSTTDPQAKSADDHLTTAAVLTDLFGAYSQPLSVQNRLLVLVFAALGLLGIAAIVTKGRPLAFVVGMDNRYSNSKVQVAVWFWIVISTYISAWVFRTSVAGWDFAGMIKIPQNLLLLSGLSAITYGGAKAITTSKADAANPAAKSSADLQTKAVADAQQELAVAEAALANNPKDAALTKGVADAQARVNNMPRTVPGAKTRATDADRNFLLNLVQNDAGGFDFGDFQMLIVSALAVTTYLMLFFHSFETVAFTKAITLPDVDTTILSVVGIGQGAYLAKKAGGNIGTS